MKADIRAKRFREDLYYRLNVIRLHLPDLKERGQEISLLSYHFFKKYSRLYQKDVNEFSSAVLEAIMAHDFPGNVRELENIVERGVILCRTGIISLKDIGLKKEQAPLAAFLDPAVLRLPFKEAKEKTSTCSIAGTFRIFWLITAAISAGQQPQQVFSASTFTA